DYGVYVGDLGLRCEGKRLRYRDLHFLPDLLVDAQIMEPVYHQPCPERGRPRLVDGDPLGRDPVPRQVVLEPDSVVVLTDEPYHRDRTAEGSDLVRKVRGSAWKQRLPDVVTRGDGRLSGELPRGDLDEPAHEKIADYEQALALE